MNPLEGIRGNGAAPVPPNGSEGKAPIAPEKSLNPFSKSDAIEIHGRVEEKAEAAPIPEKEEMTGSIAPETPKKIEEHEGFLLSPSGADLYKDLDLNGPSQLEHGIVSISGKPVNNPKFILQE
ncbi:MAG: hypothetical protein M1165_00140 [Candidatus Pacearchaeota archaeon]|nr:hypothetical protein [Candidatus Pacearchaeota archaeon]